MSRASIQAKNYDLVIVGHSLAGRLTAALTAKKGCRVLVVTDPRPESTDTWQTSSLLLERILDLLDGHSCRTGAFPFQVITDQQRIDINGDLPLADELRRELPHSHREVLAFLGDLLALGGHIEEMLWDASGLPSSGFFARQRFKFRTFRGDVPQRVFHQTLRERLNAFSDPEARKVLGTLFCGVTLTPPGRLTIADCALTWSGLGRETGVSRTGIEELLRHRFRQFHGAEASMADLKKIHVGNDGRGQLFFSDDRAVETEHLVIADRTAARRCENQSAPVANRLQQVYYSEPLGTRVSALLQPHVIVVGTPPLRLTLQPTHSGPIARVEVPVTGQSVPLVAEEIEERLLPLFPFVDLQLARSDDAGIDLAIRSEPARSMIGAADRIFPERSRHYYYAGSDILPGLGTPGEVLVAVTLCNRLLNLCKKPEL